MPDEEIGLPPCTSNRVIKLPWWNPRLTKEETEEAKLLMRTFGALQQRGRLGNDLATAWVSRPIQPL